MDLKFSRQIEVFFTFINSCFEYYGLMLGIFGMFDWIIKWMGGEGLVYIIFSNFEYSPFGFLEICGRSLRNI